MENKHELSYKTLKRVYLGSYEHYKGVGAEVELLKPGFELDDQEWVEIETFSFGRNLDEGEATTERVSNDTKEMAIVLTFIDATTVLLGGVVKVPTGSGSIPTAAEVPTGSDVVPTAGPIFATATMVTPYTRRKGKEKMIKFETPKKKKIQEQMYIQMARQLEEEMEREDQRMNEKLPEMQRLQEYMLKRNCRS
uniref:Uncharacterized protein n=1 Tax=Tanacetum cinerariifolium TaxID=118510 RepID=A0A6L2KUE1_TANCI|nr:hypothetical protein [Tanacetum cinerariifolium]